MKPDVIIVKTPPDNYSYIISSNNESAVIDPSDADIVSFHLKEMKLNLRFILATHHHSDHTAGIKSLKKDTNAIVYGGDKRISLIDKVLLDNDTITLGEIRIKVIATPGHTRGQVSYYLLDNDMVFTGDTMFGAGCGRIFEGSPEKMYDSLKRLSELPENTLVYFGHEYTLKNLEFAHIVDSDNNDIIERLNIVRKLEKNNQPTTPSTIAIEKKTNPFLRANCKQIRTYLDMINRSDIAVFAELRNRKNNF